MPHPPLQYIIEYIRVRYNIFLRPRGGKPQSCEPNKFAYASIPRIPEFETETENENMERKGNETKCV
jgi:hypothetical protein